MNFVDRKLFALSKFVNLNSLVKYAEENNLSDPKSLALIIKDISNKINNYDSVEYSISSETFEQKI